MMMIRLGGRFRRVWRKVGRKVERKVGRRVDRKVERKVECNPNTLFQIIYIPYS